MAAADGRLGRADSKSGVANHIPGLSRRVSQILYEAINRKEQKHQREHGCHQDTESV